MNEMDEQLNLWANGRLPEAQRRALEQKMAEDPQLAREAEFAKALRQSLQREPVTPPGELGLARLQKAVREERQNEGQEERQETPPRNRFWKPVAIAACLVAVVQAALLLGPELRQGGGAVDLRPASGAGAAAAQLQLVFDASASVAEMQQALLAVNGNVVAGPSALGVFHLELAGDVSPQAAAEKLRALDIVDEVIVP